MTKHLTRSYFENGLGSGSGNHNKNGCFTSKVVISYNLFISYLISKRLCEVTFFKLRESPLIISSVTHELWIRLDFYLKILANDIRDFSNLYQ